MAAALSSIPSSMFTSTICAPASTCCAATLRAYTLGDADMRSIDMPKWLLLGSMPICFFLMALNFMRFVFGPEPLHTGEAGVHE